MVTKAEEKDDAFEKIDALVAADKGEAVDGGEQEVIIEGAAPEEKPDDVQLGIDALKKQLEDEKTARADAERRATEASVQSKRAEAEAEDSNLKLIDTAIANVKREKEGLKAEFREAMTLGDFDKAAEVQDRMSTNAVNLSRLEDGKIQYQNRPKQQAEVASDPVERFAAQVSPASAKWIRAHPEYVTDPAKQRAMFQAHEASGMNGIQADTPAYFQFVEKWLGVGAEGVQKTVEAERDSPLSDAAAAPVRRQAPPAAAPGSRQSANGVTNPTVVTLTAEEREIAELNGMTPKEYAQNKAALQKAGRLGHRNYN